MKKEYNVLLGERTAEQVKMAIGSAWPYADEPAAEVRGRDLVTGLPKTILLSSPEMREAIEEPTQAIVDAVKFTLDKTPPELAADVMDRGIVLTGGGRSGRTRRAPRPRDRDAHRHRRRPLQSVVLGSGRASKSSTCSASCCPPAAAPDRRSGSGEEIRADMLPFRRIERSTVLLIGLVMLSFLIATFDVRAQGEGLGGVLRSGAQSLFAPVQQLATAVTRPVVGFIDGVSNIAGLRDKLEAARAENDILRQQLLDVQSMETRLTELERILDLTPPIDAATVTARITSLAPSEFDQIRWIDRGSDDGIALGQAVIDEDGLVGRIDFVAAGSARVRLVTDPRSGVGVRTSPPTRPAGSRAAAPGCSSSTCSAPPGRSWPATVW